MIRGSDDTHASVEGGSSDGLAQCEALVDQPAWIRLHNSPQCARSGSPRGDRAGAILCWQHERSVGSGGELPLIGDRLLVVDWRWSKDGWREVLGAWVLENVVDLERRRRDQPPPGWGPVTEEQMRAAAQVMEAILEGKQHPQSERE